MGRIPRARTQSIRPHARTAKILQHCPSPTDCPSPECARRTPPAARQAGMSAYSDPSAPACACIRPRPNSRNSAHGPLSSTSPARPAGGGSNTSRIVGCSEKLGHVTCVERCTAARIDDRGAVEIERDLPVAASALTGVMSSRMRGRVPPSAKNASRMAAARWNCARSRPKPAPMRHRRTAAATACPTYRHSAAAACSRTHRTRHPARTAARSRQAAHHRSRSAQTGSGRSPPPGTARPGRPLALKIVAKCRRGSPLRSAMALAASSVSQRPSGCGRRAASDFSVSSGSTPPAVDAAAPVLDQRRRQLGDLLLRIANLPQHQIDRR